MSSELLRLDPFSSDRKTTSRLSESVEPGANARRLISRISRNALASGFRTLIRQPILQLPLVVEILDGSPNVNTTVPQSLGSGCHIEVRCVAAIEDQVSSTNIGGRGAACHVVEFGVASHRSDIEQHDVKRASQHFKEHFGSGPVAGSSKYITLTTRR